MCALLLKAHTHQRPRWYEWPLQIIFRTFNWSFKHFANAYGWVARQAVRFAILMVVVYAAILAFGLNEFRKTPQGFIPQLDRGYLIVAVQLPPGAALARTDSVMQRAVDIALQTPGVAQQA